MANHRSILPLNPMEMNHNHSYNMNDVNGNSTMFAVSSSGRRPYGRQVGRDRHHATVKHKKKTKKKSKEKQHEIGTWNVPTMKDTGKLYALIKEIEVLNLDVLGISETRWSGSGQFDCLDSTIMYSGTEERTG